MSPRPRRLKEISAPAADFLNLPGWVTLEDPDDSDPQIIQVKAQVLSEPDVGCDRCGRLPYELGPNGTRPQVIMDEPRDGRPVKIKIRRQAYCCRRCSKDKEGKEDEAGKTALQPLPGVDDRRKITLRLREYIRQTLPHKEYTEIGRAVGLEPAKIADIFNDYVEELRSFLRFETPRWMGVEEIELCGETYCVVTNIRERTVFDILPYPSEASFSAFLKKVPDAERVKFITMDLWNDYRVTVRKVLPRVAIIVDKYHLLRSVERAVRQVKVRASERLSREDKILLRYSSPDPEIRARRQNLLKHVPEWRLAEGAISKFQQIWISDSPARALRQTEAWARQVPDGVEEFQELARWLSSWEREILAYFDSPLMTEDDHRAINAYTEAVISIIHSKSRQAPNLSPEDLRPRILYPALMKDSVDTSPRSNRARRAETIRDLQDRRSVMLNPDMKYGVPIPMLVERLTDGRGYIRGKTGATRVPK